MTRNNIRILGPTNGPVVMFAHGFGCDGGTWEKMLPYFTKKYRVVLFDHVGSGGSDLAAYDSVKYAFLDGYARDMLEICEVLDLQDVTLVAHSVSGMMAIAAAETDPRRLGRLVLLASSPSYMDHPEDGYIGGFSAEDLDGLLSSLDANYLVWVSSMAPAIMGTPNAPENAAELETSFRRVNPMVAREFSRVAFLSDVRPLLRNITVPSLILQCTDDLLAPEHIGRYLQQNLAHSTLIQLSATGHCPHVSSPGESADAILGYLAGTAVPRQVEPELNAAS
ncbi:alpha/beta hydrolase [Arthrobacter sp. UCD-GKA]|uniref:alpha/beta fold hydrolase n=1 Tax=Arthrobacter sp. UCD-GKA TaxID=1913576 RepID=UPI000ABF795B|nr:alpha/beta hydrolase [Arthrobacter sp. UCD-GKA]